MKVIAKYSQPLIPRSFYRRDTVDVARELLGAYLVRQTEGHTLLGIISETEAYRSDDPASHAFPGKGKRNAAMFGAVGHAYVYFIYGNHYCLNIVARNTGVAAGGVLIRAVVPIQGIDYMKKNCNKEKESDLASGPGKLTQAFSITFDQYGLDLTKKGELYVTRGLSVSNTDIICTPRIGISKAKDKLWRFVIRQQ